MSEGNLSIFVLAKLNDLIDPFCGNVTPAHVFSNVRRKKKVTSTFKHKHTFLQHMTKLLKFLQWELMGVYDFSVT